MNMKKMGIFFIVAVLAFTAVACKTDTPNEIDGKDNNQIEEPINSGDDEESKSDEEVKKTITLYYANEEYIEKGDEKLDQMKSIEKEIVLGDKTIEEVILEELQKQPEDKAMRSVLEKLAILGVEVKDSIAYVNISSNNLNGGSLEEALILNQVVYSLTELENIESVQFLIDGEIKETLMGHIIIDEPITRPNI